MFHEHFRARITQSLVLLIGMTLLSKNSFATNCDRILLNTAFGNKAHLVSMSERATNLESIASPRVKKIVKIQVEDQAEIEAMNSVFEFTARLSDVDKTKVSVTVASLNKDGFKINSVSASGGQVKFKVERPEQVKLLVDVSTSTELPKTFNRYKAISELGAQDQNAFYDRVNDFSRQGFVVQNLSQSENQLEVVFVKAPGLKSNFKVSGSVNSIRTKMNQAFKNSAVASHYRIRMTEAEIVNQVMAPKGMPLTENYIRNYAGSEIHLDFAQLRGEDFLRVDHMHPSVTGRQDVYSAGEVILKLNRDKSVNELWLKPKTGHYRVDTASLQSAVEALWSQGIYPRKIKLFSDVELTWDHLVFESH